MNSFNAKQSSIETDIPALNETRESLSMGSEKKTEAASTGILYVRESDFLTEETFREVLSFERKCSERTRKTLLLMLLDLSGISNAQVKYAVVRHYAQALTALATEIHIKGWYKHDTVLGVIFTETSEAEKEALREKILTKIPPSLLDQFQCLKLVFRSFSQAGEEQNDGEGSESLFYPDLTKREKTRWLSLFVKRAMDIVGGAVGIVLFSPLFIVLPLLIKATSKGPVLFKQERIGRYGEKFVFLKFRTMFVDNDPKIHQEYIKNFILEKKSYDTGPEKTLVYKIKDDPRVTPIGRFLRKTSLDELPQFFNVLKGDMSLVGPRPPIPYELENYDLWHRRRVMEIKPGITGLWQVEGRSSTTFDEMVRLDLKYSKEWTLWLDIKIILKTPWVVLAGKGAY